MSDYKDVFASGQARPVVSDPFSFSLYRFKGNCAPMVSCPRGQATNIDFKISALRRLNGGLMVVKNGLEGDHFSFELVDVDNILGYGPGVTLEIFIEKWWVTPGSPMSLILPYGSDIAAGLYMRCIYSAAAGGGEAPVPLINYYLHKPL